MRRGLVLSLLFMVVVAVGSLGATLAAGRSPVLGLDLRGGVSVVLQPQANANGRQLAEAVNIIDRRVNGLGVSNSDVAVQGNDVVINLPGIKNSQAALNELGKTAVLYFRPVLCEIPAYAGAITSTTGPKTAVSPNTVPSNTVPPTTVAGTPTTASPVTTAASTPATTAKSLGADGTPARLTAVHIATQTATTTATPTSATPTPASAPGTTGGSATTAPAAATTVPPTTIVSSTTGGTPIPINSPVSQADCSASNAAQIPSTPVQQDTKDASVLLPVDKGAFGTNSIRFVLGAADLQGTAISGASAQLNPTSGQYSVQLTLRGSDAAKFDQIGAQRYACHQQNPTNPPPCSQEAFELDGVVYSAPTFNAPSFNGVVQITGGFTANQAQSLANELKYGSLPVRFVPQSVQTVSATIGKDSLHAGLLAGLGGLAVVMLYMLVYYRALALVVLVGLGVGGAILYSIITALSYSSGLTLTLAGVTGIIVSIGITVDSYVVYFERLKDEVRAGRSVRQSVERSFSRAFRTVLAADLVSFMAALVLYLFTVGDVKGFAFTLGLSTLLDVATAYLFIRPAVIIIGRRRAFTDNPIFGISRGLGARTRPREA